MKPLELKVHPPIGVDDDPNWFIFASSAKRFTDAELAAEYWREYRELYACPSTQVSDVAKRLATIEGFVGTPHYDEQP